MALHHPYRAKLTARARALRRNMTATELKLWHGFLKTHACRFVRQKPMDDYVVDFYCARSQLAIEVDGESHFFGKALAYDQRRANVLAGMGIAILRFTNREITENFDGVCSSIAAVLEGRLVGQNPPARPDGRVGPL
jgi:very-short-patch-repair endonuclease